MANELKSLTLNGKTYTSFVDQTARANAGTSGGSSGGGGSSDGGGATTPTQTSIMPAEDAFTVGKYCNPEHGGIVDTTNHRCTEDYIALPDGAKLMSHYSANNTKNWYPSISYYDANKTYIGGEHGSLLSQEDYNGKLCVFYNVPERTRFIRLSYLEAGFSAGYFKYTYLYAVTDVEVNSGGSSDEGTEISGSAVSELIDLRTGYDGTVYKTAGEAVREQIKNVDEKIDNLIEVVPASVNKYKPTEDGWIDNSSLLSSGALQTNKPAYCITPNIAVEPNTQYTITPIMWGGLAEANRGWFYGENDGAISYISFTDNGDGTATFTTPDNARYIKLTIYKKYFNLGSEVEVSKLIQPFNSVFMLVEGATAPTEFVSYNDEKMVIGTKLIEDTLRDYAKKSEIKSLVGKTIVNFGDSIFGNAQPPTDISTFLAEKTGATVYNCGFGGCRMSPHSAADYHAFSMYKLADAIVSGDFTEQEAAANGTVIGNSLKSNFATLKTIDFSKVDIVTIAYGANDFNGASLDNEENPLDITTFGGALRYSIEKLLTAYPHLRIFILSTTWRFYINESNEYVDDSNTRTNGLGKLIADYNAQLKAVAEEYNLPFVDDYNIGIGKFNRSYYFNANDGAHHKETGRNAIASHLAKKLW